MDKVKLVLKFLKKQHFWFLLGLLVLVCTYSWYAACAALNTSFAKFKSDIEERKGKAQRISAIENHPNAEHHTQQDALIAADTKDVADAWNTNYHKQGDDILTWPTELQQDFINEVKDMRPIETNAREIRPQFLERYRDYIQKEMPKLAEIVGAPWSPKGSEGGGGGLNGPPPAGPNVKNGETGKVYLVEWNPADQEQWLAKHFDWSKKANQIPSTVEMLYAQEDLWVLKALLTIIKKVNGNIDQPHLATIKQIEFIHIGNDAATTEGTVQIRAGAAPSREGIAGGGPNAPAAPVPVAPGMAVPGMPALGGEEIADKRYVDDKYKPLSVAQLKAAISQATDESSAKLAVAKRMPIRMRLVMDTRRVHDLLSECANSPLTVEVRQVRINPDRVGKGGAAPAGGLEAAAPREATRSGSGKTTVGAYDGIVEIYGIIYIYNPVPNTFLEALAAASGAAKPAAPEAAPASAKPAVAPAAAKPAAPAPPAEAPPTAAASPATPAAPAAATPGEKVAGPKADDLNVGAGPPPAAAPAAPAAVGQKP